jgi:hypothetical protein
VGRTLLCGGTWDDTGRVCCPSARACHTRGLTSNAAIPGFAGLVHAARGKAGTAVVRIGVQIGALLVAGQASRATDGPTLGAMGLAAALIAADPLAARARAAAVAVDDAFPTELRTFGRDGCLVPVAPWHVSRDRSGTQEHRGDETQDDAQNGAPARGAGASRGGMRGEVGVVHGWRPF